MLSKLVAAAVSATVLTMSAAQAQSVSQLGDPANYPPAGFTGQQFVDNNGCVFLRAGFGGTVNWVPRVKANRRPLCDLPPTFGTAIAAAVEAEMAPDPIAAAPVAMAPAPARPVVAAAVPPVMTPGAPRRSMLAQLFGTPYVGDPIPLVPTTPPVRQVVVAAPVVLTPPAIARPSHVNTASLGQAQCFQGASQLETVLLRGGGSAQVCTRGDGTLNGWRSPQYAQGVIGGALTPRMMQGAMLAVATNGIVRTTKALPTPPKGYRLAWKDDRLNPLRGLGTATGQAQQDQVWTRDIPARQTVAAPLAAEPRTIVSTMSAQTGASYVQIGTFGQPGNAEGVRARLTALGLPVSTSKITSKGRVLQVVYAGPFASSAQAQAALATTRNAGFADAILK